MRSSRALHRPWVYPPRSAREFSSWLRRSRSGRYESYLACLREGGSIVGVFNVSEQVRGNFRSAYLGFYGSIVHAGRGLMTAGLRLVLGRVFVTLRLHRVEANIQPANLRSRALVRRCGFRMEGFSPRYLKVGGRWRDHERWAFLAEEWKGCRGSPRDGSAHR